MDLLATLAPDLPTATGVAAGKAYVILDGTLVRIDRVSMAPGADQPYYSGCEDLSALPRAGADPYSGWPLVPCA